MAHLPVLSPRAKNKIRDSGLALAMPRAELLQTRTADVLKVVYLIFSEGHQASTGDDLLRPDLCVAGVNLARGLAARRPRDPEVLGLLALLLLTDARRGARTDDSGDLVLLEEQDRTRWDRAMIDEGEGLLVDALRMGRPGPYQLWAAIAACHSTAASAADTDWRQISVLYGELLTYDPSPVTEANRAKAAQHGLTFPIVLQQQWEVSKAYAKFATPIGYLIDAEGIIDKEIAIGVEPILALLAPPAVAPTNGKGKVPHSNKELARRR